MTVARVPSSYSTSIGPGEYASRPGGVERDLIVAHRVHNARGLLSGTCDEQRAVGDDERMLARHRAPRSGRSTPLSRSTAQSARGHSRTALHRHELRPRESASVTRRSGQDTRGTIIQLVRDHCDAVVTARAWSCAEALPQPFRSRRCLSQSIDRRRVFGSAEGADRDEVTDAMVAIEGENLRPVTWSDRRSQKRSVGDRRQDAVDRGGQALAAGRATAAA